MPVELNCKECGTSFFVRPSRAQKAKYCSDACRILNNSRGTGSDNPNWKGGKISLNCKVCSQLFTVKRSAKSTAKYCSRDCKQKSGTWSGKDNPAWKGGPITTKCGFCGKTFQVIRARVNTAKFCSYSCSNRGSKKPLRAKNAVRVKNCAKCEKKWIGIQNFEEYQLLYSTNKSSARKSAPMRVDFDFEGNNIRNSNPTRDERIGEVVRIAGELKYFNETTLLVNNVVHMG